MYLGHFVHDQAGAAEVVFEQVVFALAGLAAAAVEGVFDNHIADAALPLFAAVGVGDLLYRADVKGVGNAAIAAVGVCAAVAASVWPVFKFNFVAAFYNLTWLIKAGVADGSAIAAGVVAIGVVAVGLAAGAGHGMGASAAGTIAVTADIGFVGDIAYGVEG